MKKITLFGLSILIGILCEWLSFIIYAKILPDSIPDIVGMFFLPIGLFVLSVSYLIWKKKGFIPISGVILGFAIGFVLLALGLGLGNT